MNDQLVIGAATAAITVLITVLVAWLQEIVRNRSRENARQRSLNQLKDEITAIEAWSSARIAVASDHEIDDLRTKIRRDLDAAYQRLGDLSPSPKSLDATDQRYWDLSPSPDSEERSITLRGSVSRLLLRHVPVQGWSRFTRFIYYGFLIMLLVWMSAWISQQKSWTDPVELFASAISYVILAILPTLLLAWSTVRLGRGTNRQ